ncbi:sigma-70 family RNA polymerase sigma factor [Rubripirellula reticaptiva]|uniref:ECF RNA polymerase sigma factor SigD n=1 Tax=Rubripirellula reticaptiva TaxID=2528013 RepID=A0A5C6EUH5_9BACT|nr:sigma-70 family RNA polymerase sigma factor [Rubripirellula reticaptiva]TWU51757.1 ECF RNA polymerase sigma factor SigD [Rubripirellula reticaptiva]
MSDDLEQRLAEGDTTVFGELFTIHRPRLWQIIHFRINDKIRGRVDTDDVVQEVFLDAEKRLRHYIDGDFPSFFLWLRLVTGQTVSNIHRTHLGAESRSVLREASAAVSGLWGKTSLCLSQRFVAHLTSPSQVAVKSELIDEVRQAIENMSEMDQEVLALRHFEELTNQEVAIELSIQPKAASIRYMRALERLRGVLAIID